MNDDLAADLRAWLDEPDGMPQPRLSEVTSLVARTRQQHGWLPPLAGGPTTFAALKLVSAAAVLATLGGFLVATLGPLQAPSVDPLPAAVAPASPRSAASPSPDPSPDPSPREDLRTAIATGGPIHVTGVLKGGWHRPDDSGCAHMSTGSTEWMDCFGVMDDERLSGGYMIHAVEGSALAGTGSFRIVTDEIAWQGPWFAIGSWPADVAGRSRETEEDWPHPATITIESIWLIGVGDNEGLSYALSIRHGVIDGWVFETPAGRFGAVLVPAY